MPILRFGPHELHLLRHELRRDGQRQPLPPKAYALLRLLVEQRHRVVTKGELLQAVWRRAELSPSVLGRTVMLVRRALDDGAEQPRWIQSVHGVGYRFIGDVLESDAGCGGGVPVGPAVSARGAVAVLPCTNATGDDTLDWVQVGAMALASRALAGGGHAVAPATLLKWLAAQPADALPEEQARGAIAALGLAGAVQARLSKQGPALWLEYRLYRANAAAVSGSLRGDDAATLCERLAADVVRALGRPAPAPAWRDPFIAQAYARATQLVAQGLEAAALPLLDVMAQAGPLADEAAMLHLQCLCAADPGRAAPVAQALLAGAAGDCRTEGRVHALLATRGPDAATHRAAALRCAQACPGDDWALQLQLDSAATAHAAGDAATAGRLAMRVLGHTPHPVLQARAHLQQAALDLAAGELADAEGRAATALAALRGLHRLPEQAGALALLAAAHAAAGRFDQATARTDEALQRLRDGGTAPPGALLHIAAVHLERGDGQRLRQALEVFGPGDDAERTAARAMLALVVGDAAGATAGLHAALAMAARAPAWPLVHEALPLLLRLQACHGGHLALETTAQALGRSLPAAADGVLCAAVVRAQAGAQWQAGSERSARRTLAQLVRVLPAGRAQALARIDLAWLVLERGDLDGADQLLRGLGPWLREHPAGLAVRARRLHAEGRHTEALGSHAQALLRHGGAVPLLQRSLKRLYAAGAGVPRLPVLASDAWWTPAAELHTAPAAG